MRRTPSRTKFDSPAGELLFENVQFTDWNTRELGFHAPEHPSDPAKRVAERIYQLAESSLVLFENIYTGLDTGGGVAGANFTNNPEFMKGRENGRQGVYAGSLAVTTEADPTVATFVAVKPYDVRANGGIHFGAPPVYALVHDLATNIYLNRLSSGTAYEPHGVLRDANKTFVSSLVTTFKERSTSLDNIFSHDPSNEEAHAKRIWRAIELGNFGLGIVCGAQIIHGDAFPQNFAVDGKRVVLNDTTTFRPFYNSKRHRNGDRNQHLLNLDVTAFFAGVFDQEGTSEVSRGIARSVLRTAQSQRHMYSKYMNGVRLGAERAGHPTDGPIVREEVYASIINNAIEQSGESRQYFSG